MRRLSQSERRAIEALKHAVAKWPDTLTLVQHFDSSGSLSVKFEEDIDHDDPAKATAVDFVRVRIVCCT